MPKAVSKNKKVKHIKQIAKLSGLSKLERLAAVGYWVRRGQVHFPKDGSTNLVNQMVNFGAEKHDDLVDAFTMLCVQVMEYAKNNTLPISASKHSGPMKIPGGFMNLAVKTYGQEKKFNVRTLENDPYGF